MTIVAPSCFIGVVPRSCASCPEAISSWLIVWRWLMICASPSLICAPAVAGNATSARTSATLRAFMHGGRARCAPSLFVGGDEPQAGGQRIAEDRAFLARLELDDLLEQYDGAFAAGQGAHGIGELRPRRIVEIARAIAGTPAELRERERDLVGLGPVARNQWREPRLDVPRRHHRVERPVQRHARADARQRPQVHEVLAALARREPLRELVAELELVAERDPLEAGDRAPHLGDLLLARLGLGELLGLLRARQQELRDAVVDLILLALREPAGDPPPRDPPCEPVGLRFGKREVL